MKWLRRILPHRSVRLAGRAAPWRRPQDAFCLAMVELTFKNWLATVLRVGGTFSPLREGLGLHARELTPNVVRKIAVLSGETRSYKRAVIALAEADVAISIKTVERVVHEIGGELAARRDTDPKSDNALALRGDRPPELAIVECDGGRIRCRHPDRGPGVHPVGEGWRETKIACLIRAQRQTFEEDPQPDPPECFCDPWHVAKLAQTEALSVAAPVLQDSPPTGTAVNELWEDPLAPLPVDWRPKRLVRTVLASMADSKEFGKQMQREAKRRQFPGAVGKAFLGDGLPWNWSIWKERFCEFTPILDFIHALSYVFVSAKALYPGSPSDAWSQYLVWMRGCWQGDIGQVLDEMRAWQTKMGEPPEEALDQDPRIILAKAINYLENNRSRMQYDTYRQQGLPVTTAWMESLVKEMNYRVKGTEMWWNDPQGAEAILQIRAAGLSEDERLTRHLDQRPGSPFTRPPKAPKTGRR